MGSEGFATTTVMVPMQVPSANQWSTVSQRQPCAGQVWAPKGSGRAAISSRYVTCGRVDLSAETLAAWPMEMEIRWSLKPPTA